MVICNIGGIVGTTDCSSESCIIEKTARATPGKIPLRTRRAGSECFHLSIKSLGGIGVAKQKRLASVGVKSGQDLVLVYEQKLAGAPARFNDMCGIFNRDRVKIVKGYVKQVVLILKERAIEVGEAENKIESLESEIQTLMEENVQPTPQPPLDSENDSSARPFQVLPFWKFGDDKGCNGRFFSPYYVENVLNSYFQLQKPGMKARVCNLGGEVLSIDFQYKSAHRVKVYINGKPFSPFKAMATILNEVNMVVWWAFLRGSRSFTKIEKELRALKRQFDRIQGPDKLKVIYVDNCCQVCSKLQAIFGTHVLVCLDIFHWLARWDDCIQDKKSPRYRVFKSLMSRAVLQASELEYQAQKAELSQNWVASQRLRRF